MSIIRLFLVIILTALNCVLYSQYLSSDIQKDFVDQQIENLVNKSDSIYGKDIRLVNGRLYYPPNVRADGHPYMEGPDWMNGAVSANGKTFSGLKLNYDIYKDRLIFLDELAGGKTNTILLNKNQVTRFTLEDHKFTRMGPSETTDLTDEQYFEILYEGKISLFNKWTKEYEGVKSQEFPFGRFSKAKRTRYILKEGHLFKLNKKSFLLEIFSDKKDEIKKYLKRNKINVRKAIDENLKGLFEYYYTLTHDAVETTK